ncbi:MAG: heavy metal translocating P-type ATPase, partial [Deltaproteobacteria bacterium]
VHHDEVEFIVAHGVVTEVDQKRVVIGSRHFLQDDEGIDFAPFLKQIDQKEQEGRTLLFIGFDSRLLGMISLNDSPRSNAKETISQLKELGIKRLVMLTGDNEKRASQVASELGITEVFANLKPTDKAKIVNEIAQSGAKTAFVGDGINDAPSLVCADVGISMSRGADIAKASADVSLLVDDIASVLELKRKAQSTMNLIRRNFQITIGANSAILLGATMGKFSSLTTSFLHNGTTIALLLNAMRLAKK